MCRWHWYIVPRLLREAVWRAYRPGQEKGQVLPSREYLAALRRAVDYVAMAERR